MENILRWLKGAEIGQMLYVDKFGWVQLKGFDNVNGKTIIRVVRKDLFENVEIHYDAFGKSVGKGFGDLKPSASNFRWNQNWKWTTNDCKKGDILITPDGDLFIANGKLYKDTFFLKPCSYIALRRRDSKPYFSPGSLWADNRWTDDPVSIATESERKEFFSLLEASSYYSQYLKDFNLENNDSINLP